MATKNKDYIVNVGLRVSYDIRVTAKTEGEARKKAYAKFKGKIRRSDCYVDADECSTGSYD